MLGLRRSERGIVVKSIDGENNADERPASPFIFRIRYERIGFPQEITVTGVNGVKRKIHVRSPFVVKKDQTSQSDPSLF